MRDPRNIGTPLRRGLLLATTALVGTLTGAPVKAAQGNACSTGATTFATEAELNAAIDATNSNPGQTCVAAQTGSFTLNQSLSTISSTNLLTIVGGTDGNGNKFTIDGAGQYHGIEVATGTGPTYTLSGVDVINTLGTSTSIATGATGHFTGANILPSGIFIGGTATVDNSAALGQATDPVSLIAGTIQGVAAAPPAVTQITIGNSTQFGGTSPTAAPISTFDANGTQLTFSGAISGSSTLNIVGAGSVALTNQANSFTGPIVVNTGATLANGLDGNNNGLDTFGNSNNSITLGGTLRTLNLFTGRAIVLQGAGTIDTGGTTGTTLFGTISETGGPAPLTFTDTAGGGLVTLYNGNTYSGGTTINGTTVQITSDANLGTYDNEAGTGGLRLINGTLQAGGLGIAVGRNITIGDVSVGTINSNGNAITIDGAISGCGPTLVKTGAGTLTLTNGTSSYSGTTRIDQGTIATASDAVFGFSNIVVNNGATLAYTASTTIARTIGLGSNQQGVAAAGMISVAPGATVSDANPIVDSDGPAQLTLVGGGTLVLTSQNNTYSGGTVIKQGVLQIGDGVTTGRLTGNVLDNDTLVFAPASSVIYAGSISGSGQVNLNANAAGTILRLSGNNTFSGPFNVNSGTVIAGSTTAYSPNSRANVALGATLNDGGLNVTVGSLAGAGTVILGGNQQNGNLTTGFDNTSSTFSGKLTGPGALTKVGTGTFTLTGASDYTGGTTISGGILQIGAGGATGSILGPIVDNATLAFNRSDVVTLATPVSGTGGLIQIGPGTLVVTRANTYTGGTTISGGTLQIGAGGAAGSISGDVVDNATLAFNRSDTVTFAGAISGTGGLIQSGPGTLVLTGANSFSGVTTIAAGTLQVGAGGTTGSLVGPVVDNASLVFNRSDTVALPGAISGTGALTQAGPGTLVLTGANTFTGGTTIAAGTLQVGAGGTTGSLVGPIVDNAALVFNRSDTVALPGAISGTGALTQAGPGTLVLTGANTFTGGTTIAAGALQIGAGGTTGSILGPIVDNATLAFNRSDVVTLATPVSGTGGLIQIGPGTLVVTGANTYTGGTTISGGSLQIGAGGTAGSISGDVVDNAMLAFNRSDTVTFAGAISGTGGLIQSGPGTLVLTGANSFSGVTTIAAGTLQVGAGGTTGSLVGPVVDNAALVFNRSDTLAYDGAISGTGSLTQAGPGRLVLGGASTYAGPTSVAGGTLSVNGSLASAVTVLSGATLGGNGTVGAATIRSGGTLSPGNSIGTLSVSGNLTFAPNSVYTVEVDAAGNGDRVVVGGTTTLQGGTVNVQATNGTYAFSTNYTIVTSGAVTGQFAGVTSNLAFLTPALSYSATSIVLSLTRNDVSYASVAQGNPGGVGAALQAATGGVLATTASGLAGNGVNVVGAVAAQGTLTAAGTALVSRVNSLDLASARTVFGTLSGEGLTATQEVSLRSGRLFTQQIMDQSMVGRTREGNGVIVGIDVATGQTRAYAANDPLVFPAIKNGTFQRTWRMWYSGYGGARDLGGDAAFGIGGVSSSFYGGAVGLDYQLTPDVLVGVAAGEDTSHFATRLHPTSGDVDGIHAGVYGVGTWGPFYATGTFDYSHYDDRTKRIVAGLGATEVARGRFTSDEYGGKIEAGVHVPVAGFTLTPFASIEAKRLEQPAFSEVSTVVGGSPGLLGLNVAAGGATAVPVSAGFRLDTQVDVGNGMTLTPHLRLSWIRELDRTREISAQFQALPGATFTARGARPPQDAAGLDVGADLALFSGVSLYAKFSGEFAPKSTSYAAMGGLRILFDAASPKGPAATVGTGAKPVSSPEARQLFTKMVAEPDNLDVAFRYSELASQSGDYEAAIGALERMLFYNPDLPRVKLELGVLYFRLASYQMAKYYFDAAVANPATPADVRDRVAEFQVEIDKRLSPSQLTYFGQAGLRYQTNANAGPNDIVVRALGQDAFLDPRFGKKGDGSVFGLATVRHVYDFQTQRGDTWETTVSAFGSKQFTLGRFDLGIGELQTGPRLAVDPDRLQGLTFRPYALVNGAALGGNPYLVSYGGGAAFNYVINPNITLEPGIEVRQRDYSNSRNYPNATDQTGTLLSGYLVGGGVITAPLRWQARTAFSRSDARTRSESYDQFNADLAFPIDVPVTTFGLAHLWTVTPSVGFSETRYDAPDLIVDPNVRRRDTERRVAVALEAPFSAYAGFAASIIYAQVRSTIRNYDTHNLTVLAGPTVRF